MISVLNYGAGNANSVVRMIERAGGRARLVETPSELLDAEKLIVPGVGAFDRCISQLHERKLKPVLDELALKRKIPLLGICMGMQMMCRSSEEGVLPGLGWFDAEVKRFTKEETGGRQIPHMGWNTVTLAKGNTLITPSADDREQRFYFVHSYRVSCHDAQDILARTAYGEEFVCAIARENLFGVQFHPEKSHRFGLELIRRFVEF